MRRLHAAGSTGRAGLTGNSAPEEEAAGLPIEEWLTDPADDQRYEAGLRALFGAVEALEERSEPEGG